MLSSSNSGKRSAVARFQAVNCPPSMSSNVSKDTSTQPVVPPGSNAVRMLDIRCLHRLGEGEVDAGFGAWHGWLDLGHLPDVAPSAVGVQPDARVRVRPSDRFVVGAEASEVFRAPPDPPPCAYTGDMHTVGVPVAEA